MKKLRKLKKGLAIVLTAAMVVGLLPGVGTMQISAEEEGSATTSTTASVTFSALDGNPEGYNSQSDERYLMLLDGDPGTKWCCSFESGSTYVIFKASQLIYVDGYAVWTANDSASEEGARNPVAWTLSACNDYDETNKSGSWNVIHEVKGDNSEEALPAANETEKKYSFDKTTNSYQYFKLNITSIKSGSTMQLGDFALSYTPVTCDEHQWGVTKTIEPTCTEGGYTEETCSVCRQVQQTNPTDALGHDYVNEICTRCGSEKVQFMATAGTAGASDGEGYTMLVDRKYSSIDENNYSKWCVTRFTKPTTSDEGVTTGGAYIIFEASEPVTVNGYTIVTGDDNKQENNRNPKTWTLYGCNDSSEGRDSTSWEVIHSVTNDDNLQDENIASYKFELVASTATQYQYFKLEITETKGSDVMQMSEFILDYSTCEHNWEKTGDTIAPTCTEDGYDVYQCTKCYSKKNKANGKIATGHKWVSGDIVAPTCTEDGYTPQNCSVCKAEQKIDIKSALGHDFDNDNDTCTRCGAGDTTLKQPSTDTNGVYQIGTAGELYWFAGLVNGDASVCTGEVSQNTSAKAVLTADITVNSELLSSLEYGSDGKVTNGDKFTSWTPIGNGSNKYTGTFDGNNKKISGLYNNTGTSRLGLFGEVVAAGTVKNVGIVDSYFNGNNYIGGVCGENHGKIENCYNTGAVNGKDYIGGVCGYSQGKIENCYNTGAVNGNKDIGGVCGNGDTGTITNCYNAGAVNGNEDIGGVCGYNYVVTITNCYNTGAVNGNKDIGGVCGENHGKIENCYNTGAVNGKDYIGGVCGKNGYAGRTANCYNVGLVSLKEGDTAYVGGVCGYNEFVTGRKIPIIANCYYDSKVYTGKAVGVNVDGGTVADNVLDKTTDEFASGEVAYLLSQGCTVDGTTYDGSVWGQDLSTVNASPVLDSTKKVYRNEIYAGCEGNPGDPTYEYSNTEKSAVYEEHSYDNGFCTICDGYMPANDSDSDGVYEISNAGQLYWFAYKVNNDNTTYGSANAVLTANISVNERVLVNGELNTSENGSFRSWMPIGNDVNPYIGTFDGQGYTVSGLYVNDVEKEYVGLFGFIQSGGCIKKVGVVDSYFNGKNTVGGVCGLNKNGTIENCYNKSYVSGTKNIGGVCGYNYSSDGISAITKCFNTGKVEGTGDSVGGVCGLNSQESGASATVTNCYYLAATETEDGGKTDTQFKNGEVAYLLSQGCTIGETTYDGNVWGQTLGDDGDAYPVLKKTGDEGNTVYQNIEYSGCSESNQGETTYVYANKAADPVYAEHTDENLDGKCDVCTLDFKTFEQLGKLIIKVNQNLSDGKYADVQYTTASIDNLRKALVAANAITAQSLDTDVAAAFDNLLAASTVDKNGLIAADHNIVIAFADTGAVRGIAAGTGWYANGDTVTLKVTPSVGYTFSKWTTDTAGNTSAGTGSTYTFTLAAESPVAYYAWFDEVKYIVTCNTAEGGTCSTDAEDGKYVYGQTATVTATAGADYEFVGWKDSYGTTVSTDAVYSFTVLGDTTLTPVFVKTTTEQGDAITYVIVSFYHQSGKLLDSQKLVTGEGKITATVNAPTKVGFDFLGWSTKASGATAADVVKFAETTFSEDTSLYPVFAAQNITYTLTVDLQTEQKAPQSSVTVTADPIEGKQFVGWKNAEGNIVSYDSTYTFIITGDTTLTSYYEPISAVIEKTPTINMSAPVYEVSDNIYKMIFYFDYTIPKGCTLIDIGTIRLANQDKSTEGITFETEGVRQCSVLSKLGVDGQFYYSKSNYIGNGHTVAGYMIYEKNGIRYTVYSNAIYGIKTSN